MVNNLRRLQTGTFVLGAAMATLLCLPTLAQSSATSATQNQRPASATQDQQAGSQDRQAGQTDDVTRRDLARFDQFLDSHREIAEQLRKTPSLIDDPQFLQSHPELNAYLQAHPSVKQEIGAQPNTFMRLEDSWRRDASLRDRDAGGQGGQDRDNDRRDVANFNRFLDDHREIAEQVRKDPSLLDNRNFVQNHPALQTYLQDNPGVRDQLRQSPVAFMQQEDALNRDSDTRYRDPMRDHMADFGGFLHNHSDIQKDLSRNPSVVKDHEYVQNHADLDAYLNAHPDVRDELMANPQSFVHGAQQYGNESHTGTPGGSGASSGSGAGVTTGRGTGTPGTGAAGSMTGTPSANPTATPQAPPKPTESSKPNH